MPDGADYDGPDFYCDVAIPHPERLRVVHEDRAVLAFHQTTPARPFYIVVVPTAHSESLVTARPADWPTLRDVLRVVQSVARTAEEKLGGARVVTNIGRYQDSKHLHIHVLSEAAH